MFKNSNLFPKTECMSSTLISEERENPYTALTDWFLKPRRRVCTTWYELALEYSQMRFVVDKVPGQVFPRAFQFSFVTIIPFMLHTHLHLHLLPEGQRGEAWEPSKK
jgi:hypothetical protein